MIPGVDPPPVKRCCSVCDARCTTSSPSMRPTHPRSMGLSTGLNMQSFVTVQGYGAPRPLCGRLARPSSAVARWNHHSARSARTWRGSRGECRSSHSGGSPRHSPTAADADHSRGHYGVRGPLAGTVELRLSRSPQLALHVVEPLALHLEQPVAELVDRAAGTSAGAGARRAASRASSSFACCSSISSRSVSSVVERAARRRRGCRPPSASARPRSGSAAAPAARRIQRRSASRPFGVSV